MPWVEDVQNFYRLISDPTKAFPQYCFIEPHYGVRDKTKQNDQHPPSDVMAGDNLIGRVYNAIRARDSLWQRCLFVITYDEHGGFYDHVDPPPTGRRTASPIRISISGGSACAFQRSWSRPGWTRG